MSCVCWCVGSEGVVVCMCVKFVVVCLCVYMPVM